MTRYWSLIFLLAACNNAPQSVDTPIDREAVVRRHTIHVNKADSLSSLSVGNGRFAFTVDATGLQSFPEAYQGGVALGTQSEWGWNSFPNTAGYRLEETYRPYELEGRTIPYTVQWKTPLRNKEACDYFRANPHRLQLGNIGLDIRLQNGQLATIHDIQQIDQQLDMWTGEIISKFSVEGTPVEVHTCAHQQQDLIGVKIVSPLLQQGRLSVHMVFPYPTAGFKDVGTNYTHNDRHHSAIESQTARSAILSHTLDSIKYYIQTAYQEPAAIAEKEPHHFYLSPAVTDSVFETVFLFTKDTLAALPSYDNTVQNSREQWAAFWQSGGAVDFEGSTDERAMELERRIVLSQYLTKVQCAGGFPPQETGLTYNSWYGKPHLEMNWWHAVHFALWGRPQLLEQNLDWYVKVADGARDIARRQGFDGVRWQKMTDHNGRETPSSVGAFLVWQQPHFIYMAELLRKADTSSRIMEKYKDLVFATADFMASFPSYDSVKKQYNLGKGLIPAQECFDAVKTFNPTYELAYWAWGLEVAQQWREKLGMPREAKWDTVLQHLAPLPQANGVYLATESTPDCYTTDRYKTDHPAVLAALASIPPADHLDTAVMHKTFDLVWDVWHWKETWGWDFPLTAMTATRLNLPAKAIDALFMPIQTNTYLVNGHNYQDDRLTIYLPGNGGLLSAIALMCAGYDHCTVNNPGFPKDGTWKVKWEGLEPMP